MLRVICPVKDITAVAVSGGIDSMVLLHFLRRANPNVVALHFNHKTPFGESAASWLSAYCREHNITMEYAELRQARPAGESLEHWWREERYRFFLGTLHRIAIAHNLDDQIETYIMNMARGNPRFMPYSRDNICRPLLLSPRSIIQKYAEKHSVPYMNDPSNADVAHPRNRVRHNIIPELLGVNPGLYRTFARLALSEMARTTAGGIAIGTEHASDTQVFARPYERMLELD